MRTPFIAGNWKMNLTVAEAVSFVNEVKDQLDAVKGIESAFCVPAIALPDVAAALSRSTVYVGAQTMANHESGAYTGEISPLMIKPFADFVILGHSERREYYGETDALVNEKTKLALAHGIRPIVACGESLAQNQAGETQTFVSGQVRAALAGISADDMLKIVIAYEPIWAIGTGLSATVEQAGGIIKSAVRDTLTDLCGEVISQQVRIQYGGSVKPHNIADYMSHPDIDGALVGGASLKPDFVELVANGAASKAA